MPHPDGSYWFTDPPYGGQLYEGTPDAPGGPSNPTGGSSIGSDSRPRSRTSSASCPRPCIASIRAVASTRWSAKTSCPNPNGLTFSPDYKKLYVISTGPGPGDKGPGGKRDMHVFDVGADNKLSNQKLFSDFMVDGIKCGPDGARCDIDGNVWVSSNGNPGGRGLGYSGVTVWTPEGKLIGRIRLPEVCANIAFGGPKRNRLFMCGSQSLYALYVNTQGAAPS